MKLLFESWRQLSLTEAIDPATVKEIESVLDSAGAETYIVGGAVRDDLLPDAPPSKDIDFLVRGLPIEDLIRVLEPLGKVVPMGMEFGTVTAFIDGESFDFALPRTEESTGRGHKDFKIIADHTAPVEEDLGRRDFTMNALAKDSEGNIIDMFGGIQDIQDKVIRAVGDPLERFKEDPLRILRAIQFAVRFGFDIESETAAAMERYANRLDSISKERILAELTKAWTKGYANSDHLVALLEETGVGQELFGPSFRPIPIKAEGDDADRALGNFISFFLLGGNADRLPLSREMSLYLQLARDAITGKPAVEFASKHRDKLSLIIQVLDKAGYSEIVTKLTKSLEYPLNPKELDITGQDLMQMGFRGIDIGDALNNVMLAVHKDEIQNNYDEITRYLQG
jgi:tRNA nucleotidyltransferase/poly(A) polymerase